MVQNKTYRCYLNPLLVCQGLGRSKFVRRGWVTSILDPDWVAVDISGVRWTSAVAVRYVNMLRWKTVRGGLVSIFVRLLMFISGTFGIRVGLMSRRVCRVTIVLLTVVVVKIVREYVGIVGCGCSSCRRIVHCRRLETAFLGRWLIQ